MMSEERSNCPNCKAEVDNPDFQFCPYCQKPLVLLGGVYRLEFPLEQGAHGVVYLSHRVDQASTTKYAIKVLKKDALHIDPQLMKRFKKEVRLLQKLSGHPNIVNVIEADEDEVWGAYYVMEYIPGVSLQALLDQQSLLPPNDIYQVVDQLFVAISHAHELDMIHRDLKPGNILIYQVEDGYGLKVIDFGLAKLLTPSTEKLTQTHAAMGTPHYMAPEQWGNQGVGKRADIYSLGIIVYQLLTGSTPFEGADTIMELTHAHLRKSPPPFSEVQPGATYPDELEQAVSKSLEKAPNDRYLEVTDFWESLRAPLHSFSSSSSGPVSAFDPTAEHSVESLTQATPPTHSLHGLLSSLGARTIDAPELSPARSGNPRASSRERKRLPVKLWVGMLLFLLVVVLLGTLTPHLIGTEQHETRPDLGSARPRQQAPIPPQRYSLAPGTVRGVRGLPDAKQVFIPPGRFLMGSPPNEPGRDPDEQRHQVVLSKGFWIMQTEVTHSQFSRLMRTNPSAFKKCGGRCPVERVTFVEAMSFANQLSRKHKLSACYICKGKGAGSSCALKEEYKGKHGKGYNHCLGWRLPTEAEWEYAARAGSPSTYPSGKCLSSSQANYDGTRPPPNCPKTKRFGRPRAVGLYPANSWKLYDMSGNVWEWTWDIYTKEGRSTSVTDPVAAGSHLDELLQQKVKRVMRGGSWFDPARFCRLANRYGGVPGSRYHALGFRLVRTEQSSYKPPL